MRALPVIPVAAIPVLAVCAVLAVPAPAPAGFWIGPPPLPSIPAPRPGGVFKGSPHRGSYFGERPRRPDRRHKPRHWPRRPVVPYGYYYDFDDFDDYDDRDEIIIIPPSAAPPAAEPSPEAAPADQPPPDPRGRARFIPARGVPPGPSPYAIGEPLPPGVPHVTLDWVYYGLPEAPPGLIYARVGREVLLIDAVSRVVEERIEPQDTAPPRD